VPTYARIVYDRPLTTADLVIDRRAHGLKYSIHCTAAPSSVGLLYEGADEVRTADGGTALEVLAGAQVLLRESGLRCYYADTGEPVSARFGSPRREGSAWRYSIEIESADASRPLVIDPTVSWSSYLGGLQDDHALSVALDAQDRVSVTGTTNSTNFPTSGPGVSPPGSLPEAFVAKISSDGTTLLWCTHFGGTAAEYGTGLALDSWGNTYVTGTSYSDDFPVQYPIQGFMGGMSDSYVAKFAEAGTLVWATYLGGEDVDDGVALAVDATGAVLVGGTTRSNGFPIVGGFQSAKNSPRDAFVAKIDSAGTALIWSSYFGGTGDEFAYGVSADTAGNVYLCGQTGSTSLSGAVNPYGGGTAEGYVAKISSSGSTLIWTRYLGGSNFEGAYAISVTDGSSVFVTGRTNSSNFPASGGFQTTLGGIYDAFAAQLDGAGSLVWGTYLGGSGNDFGQSIARDSAGNLYLAGYTASSVNFPMVNPFQATFGGAVYDAFGAKITVSGGAPQLVWSSFFGGNGDDYAYAGQVSASGASFVVAGKTSSTNLPGTWAGAYDVLIAKGLSPPPSLTVGSHELAFEVLEAGPPPEPQEVVIGATGDGTLAWTATPGASWLAVSPGSGAMVSGGFQTLIVSIDPAGLPAGSYAATVVVGITGGGPTETINVSMEVLGMAAESVPEDQGSQGGGCFSSAVPAHPPVSLLTGIALLLLALRVRR